MTVLDLGCGAGMDSIIAATLVAPTGHVIGVDFSTAMLQRARSAASEAGLENLEFLHGDAEHIPLLSGSVDVALVNGIFNLNPYRTDIFTELDRVVRDDGVVYAAELILANPLPESESAQEQNWFA